MIRFKPVRESYIPANSRKVTDKKSDAIAYVYENGPRHCMRVFYGKQAKPVAAFYYKNEAQRTAAIARYFQSRQASTAYKTEQLAKRKAWVNDYKIGDIVNTCWGYDQTNREFYEIIAVKGKQVTLREIAVDSKSTGWCQEKVIPLPGQFIGEPFTRLAQERGIKIGKHSFTYAHRTSYKEIIPGVKAYETGHTSSYA